MALPYIVAPHLEYFNIPLGDFTAERPQFDGFCVGGYIFSQDIEDATSPPRILLLQRSLTDTMGGCWEGPGGAYEPGIDATILDGVVREVLEESGLHVSQIVELVAVDSWLDMRRNNTIVKYSFLVEVHEAMRTGPGEVARPVSYEMIPIRLEATEHQAFDWATEGDIRESLQTDNGRYQLPSPPRGHQAPNILRAFALWEEYQRKRKEEAAEVASLA